MRRVCVDLFLDHVALSVPDVRAVVAQLKAKGAQMAFEVVDNPGAIFAFVSDNAGNAVELIQHTR